MKYPRGSLWRKWDLHVHTPESFTHQFTFSESDKVMYGSLWDKYVAELERVKDVKVIAVTDYFSIDGYKRVRDYREQGRLANFDCILCNVELRLNTIIPSRHSATKKLNYHIIFSDEVDPTDIETDLLQRIEIRCEKADKRQLNKANIERIGRILKEQQPELEGSDYRVGCENIFVLLDDVLEILQGKPSLFEGKYLLVLPNEGWSDIDWKNSGHLMKKVLAINSHALFSANPKTRQWGIGERSPEPNPFLSAYSGDVVHRFR